MEATGRSTIQLKEIIEMHLDRGMHDVTVTRIAIRMWPGGWLQYGVMHRRQVMTPTGHSVDMWFEWSES